MTIRLHHCYQTRSERVLWLLHELGVDFTLEVHAFGRSLRDPDFLAKSPAGRVPALEIGDQSYFESGALLEILCERYPAAGLGRGAGEPERPDWLVWLHFGETVTAHTAALTLQHIMLRPVEARSPVLMKLERARLSKCYDAIEARLSLSSETDAYILSSGFSAADIAVGSAVHIARRFEPLDAHPKIRDWIERLTARPAFQAAQPPEGVDLLYTQDRYLLPED